MAREPGCMEPKEFIDILAGVITGKDIYEAF
jgi:hypothetical protein